MAVTNSFTGELATELLKQLFAISAKPSRYRNTAEQLITLIENIRQKIKRIEYGGMELPAHRQAQIRMFVENLEKGHKLTNKVLSSSQWNLYRQLTLAKRMEKLKKTISGVLTKIVADVHRLQVDYNVRRSSSSSSSSSFTNSLMTPSMEFPDRISFRKMDLSEAGPSGTVAGRENTGSKSIKIGNFSNPEDIVLVTSWLKSQLLGRGSFGSVDEGISGDGDIFAVNDVSLLDQGSQTQECIQQLEAEIALLSQLQHQNIMSSSSSSVDSDSICSLMTPSLEFPDRISFRKKDLNEAGTSFRDPINFQIRGVGEMDQICRSLGVFGPEDFAISLDGWEASKKRSSSDSHKVQAQHLSEAETSGVVVASISTNREITELTPSQSNKIENLSTGVDKEVVDGGMIENKRGIERNPTILVKSRGNLVPNGAVAVGGNIKGVRTPPVLKPLPSMKQPPIDLHGSSWDFLTRFASAETVPRPSTCVENDGMEEELETEKTGAMLGDTTDEACSFTSNEGDSSVMNQLLLENEERDSS